MSRSIGGGGGALVGMLAVWWMANARRCLERV
jgi:hypothetical protein